ncbi:MAG TPA: OmpA family protein [Nitrospiria bacterium]|nr:OmpA family protein [Nitrospiria bacterium]
MKPMDRSLLGILLLTFILDGCVSEQSFQTVIQQLERERSKSEHLLKQIELLKAEAAKFSGLTSENETLIKKAAEDKIKADELLAKIASQAREIESLSKKKGAVVVKKPDMSWAKGLTDSLQSAFRDEIRKGDVQVQQTQDRLILTLAEPLLFEPDDVEVAVEGEEPLIRLGEVLKKVKDQQIVIGGHFDDAPIAPSMAREFPTAWEFSGMRAISVVRFLQEESQIGGRVLSAGVYGSARPVASNTTEDGRLQNRRIEVTIIP